MTLEELKLYNVLVKDGSGCLFQPISEDKHTYILTAKHLFEGTKPDENGNETIYTTDDGTKVSIIRIINNNGVWSEMPLNYTLEKGITYFPHNDADAAILKVEYQQGFDKIFVSRMPESVSAYSLQGFPALLRGRSADQRNTSYPLTHLIGPGTRSFTAQLFNTTLNKLDIEGMSGGGITKKEDAYISLIGIQSEMKHANNANGQINFVPIQYFNEIIEANPGNLARLLPPYFKSFSFLEGEIFKLNCGVLTKEKSDKLTKILKAKAIEIKKSDLTPSYIKEFLQQKIPIFYEQEENELQKKNIWGFWLELLTILNIAKNCSHSVAHLPVILKKVRLFYSNINEDFWIKHLPDLHKMDYSGLDDDGIVVVASNVEAQDKFHILDLSRVPGDISRIKESKEDFELGKIGQKTDNASAFPLEKYKFMNISAFKEGAVSQFPDQFTADEITICLTTLKELYEQLIPNW